MAHESNTIDSVEKTFKLIELMIAHNGKLSVTQIADALDCSISSANRFLQTIQAAGYIDKNSVTKRYELNYKLFSLTSRMVENDIDAQRLIAVGRSVSQKYDVSVNINTIVGTCPMLIASITRHYNKDADYRSGDTAPAYCTSSGKALLSLLPRDVQEEYFSTVRLTAFQNRKVTVESLRNELRLAKANGFTVCDGEYVSGVFSYSLPYCSHDGHLYAFTVIAPMSERRRIFNKEIIADIRRSIDKDSWS